MICSVNNAQPIHREGPPIGGPSYQTLGVIHFRSLIMNLRELLTRDFGTDFPISGGSGSKVQSNSHS